MCTRLSDAGFSVAVIPTLFTIRHPRPDSQVNINSNSFVANTTDVFLLCHFTSLVDRVEIV